MSRVLRRISLNVRIHTDSVAAKSAQSINALAYTSGNNIVFNSGQYAPGSESGQRLMAHELTHIVQQNNNHKGTNGKGGISRKVEQVNFNDSRGTSLINSQNGKLDEERHGTINEIDTLHANLEDVFRAGLRSLNNSDMIKMAIQKDEKLYKTDTVVGPKEKSSIATTLIEMYNILDARIKVAQRGSNGLPSVEGIKWEVNDPLAGILEAILPFGNLDFWETFLIRSQSKPKKRHGHGKNKETISFEDENGDIVIGRGKIPKEFSDIGKETLSETEQYANQNLNTI